MILIAWIVVALASQGSSLGEIVTWVGLVLAMFACVTLHELGHGVTAQRFGITVRDITLLPIGGVARLERPPERPLEEFLVAIAGPAVNVAIALILWVVIATLGGAETTSSVVELRGEFLSLLLYANVILVLFNLIPAFPMDGGRVLRSILTARLGYARSTAIAAGIGQGIALMLGVLALFAMAVGMTGWFSNPFLVFIAVFVYLGAQAENRYVQLRAALHGVQVRDAMTTQFQVLHGEQRLTEIDDTFLSGSQTAFPVLSGDRLIGIVGRRDLAAASGKAPEAHIGDTADRSFAVVGPGDDLLLALGRMRAKRVDALAVVDGNSLIGLLTTARVNQMVEPRHSRGGREILAEIFATD